MKYSGYILKLAITALLGWALSNWVIIPFIDHALLPNYGQYDWYESFMSVVDLILTYVVVGLALAWAVHLLHPEDE